MLLLITTNDCCNTGSCRYDDDLFKKWQLGFASVPTRMVMNTRSFIYILENIRSFSVSFFDKQLEPSSSQEFLELMFLQDANDAERYREFWGFMIYALDYGDLESVLVEITTRKVYYYHHSDGSLLPISAWVVKMMNTPEIVDQYNLTFHELSDEEISADLDYIQHLLSVHFSPQVRLKVILHLDMKLKKNKKYIPKRHELCLSLERLCLEKNISVFNPGRVIESHCQSLPNGQDGEHYRHEDCATLEHWAGDGAHWSNRSVIQSTLFADLSQWVRAGANGDSVGAGAG
jgi:hypothetical protein